MPDIPSPTKRQSFTPKQVAAVFLKHDGRCASCTAKVKLGDHQIDHIQPLDLLGLHSIENWQLLCTDCHKRKTARDIKRICKARRLRGETGNRHKRKIQSRGFQKPPENHKHHWPKRGFGR